MYEKLDFPAMFREDVQGISDEVIIS